MKRLLSIAAAAVLFFAAAPAVTASAADTQADSSALSFTAENKQVCITGCKSSIKELVIPEKLNDMPVTSIGKSAFLGNSDIVSCVIPDSVRTIDENAFSNCRQLTSVSIGSGVSSIDSFAFSACPKLTSFTVSKDNSTYTAVSSCLYNKSGDTLLKYAGGSKAAVPDKTKTIGTAAFFAREDVASVSIPDTVTAIGPTAFTGCLSLKAIDIPDSVRSVGNNCFMSCSSLSRVKLGSGIDTIPLRCFQSCTALNNIIIPDNIKSIGDEAFYSCAALSGIWIPKTVTSIGDDAVGRRYDTRTNSSQNITGFVIKGEKGSAAEKYASDCGIIFGTRICQKGDVTGDGVIDAVDASAVLTEYALISTDSPLSFNVEQNIAADFDGNGTANAVDASLILEKYAENAVKH